MEAKIYSGTKLNILSLEDSVEDFDLICMQMNNAGCILNISRVEKESEFSASLCNNQYDIILSDFNLPGFDAFGALRIRDELCPEVPFICVSGSIGEELAIELLKLGASDYVLKDRPARLPFAVNRALDEAKKKAAIRQAEETLNEINLFNEQIIKGAHEGIIVYDRNMKYLAWNPFMENLTGCAASEVLGRYPMDLFPFLNDAGVIDTIEKAIHGEATGVIDFPFSIPSTGKSGWTSDATSSLRNANGEIIGVITTVRDITEKKLAEQEIILAKERTEKSEQDLQLTNKELLEKNILIQTILDNLPIGLALNKFDGGSATYMNKKFQEIYGWPYESIHDIEDFYKKIYPDEAYRNSIVNRVLADIESGDPDRLHWEGITITRQDGSKGVINAVNIPITEQNTMISTVMDLTDLHRINQDLLKAKEHAEESDRLKTAFLTNISHEIRTPMNGILGFAELLKTPELEPEEVESYLQVIELSGNRMLDIINDIVDISKIEAGQMNLHIERTNVSQLLRDLYLFFKPEAEKKKLSFSYKTAIPSEELILRTDHTKLAQILSNLIKNALKFTQTGSVEFGYGSTCSPIGSTSSPVNSTNSPTSSPVLTFFVRDTGIGIPSDKLDIIFERFRQVNESSNRPHEGAGLGLPISKAFVEKLGGRIWVESEFGEGSVFFVELPGDKFPEEKPEIKVTSPEPAPSQSLKILIAENDEISLAYLNAILLSENAIILEAENGKQAVELVKSHPEINLVLMDLKMPEMDGYEATRLIKELRPELQVIAQTAYAFSDDREKAIKAGCNGYLTKPIRKSELLELLKKISLS